MKSLLLGTDVRLESSADLHGSCGFGEMTEEAVSYIYRPVYKQD